MENIENTITLIDAKENNASRCLETEKVENSNSFFFS